MTKQFKNVVPLFWVADVRSAIKYYTEKLGFEVGWICEEGDEVSLAIIERDGYEFRLQVCCCDDLRHTGNTFFEIQVDDVEKLYNEYKASNVEFVNELKEQEWGLTDFKVRDPEGNWILFTSQFDDD